jgi:NADPH:quinone reductase-like Zn-dependent oxidoreductase
MKAVVLHAYGPATNLAVEEIPAPTPSAGQVLIAVHAAGVNPIDWKVRSGAMHAMFDVPFPWVPGYDIAGVVESVGEAVTTFRAGDRFFGRGNGAYAEQAVAPATDIALIPEGIDFNTAAALPVVATTADQLVREACAAKPGQTILLTGALGSVGRLALYRAVQMGVHVIAAVRARQLDEALALGAQQAVDASDPAALAAIGKVDAVADTIGGPLSATLLPLVKDGGNYASIVGPPQNAASFPGIHVHAFGSHPDAEPLVFFANAIRDGKLKLPVALVLPLAQAAEAHAKGEQGGAGKIVLSVTPA